MKRRSIMTGGVALICAAAGAAAGISGGTAATNGTSTKARAGSAAAHGARGRWARIAGLPGRHGPEVHEVAVVLNKAGDGFITVTSDTGTLQSVSGDQLTLKEAVGSVTYRTVTLTIPSGATAIRNFKSASLSDLRAGDSVRISSSTEGTTVYADDGSTLPPHALRAPGAPPPGLPGAAPPGMQRY